MLFSLYWYLNPLKSYRWPKMGQSGCAHSCQKTLIWLLKHEISFLNSKLSSWWVSTVATHIRILMFDFKIILRWKSRNFDFWRLILGDDRKMGSKFCLRHINVIRKYKLHNSAMLPLCFLWLPTCFLTVKKILSCKNVQKKSYGAFYDLGLGHLLSNTYFYFPLF